jgi:antitoxin ParD1/3/4
MNTVEKINVAIPAEVAAIVREAVDGGEFASSSEVVGEALLAWSRLRGGREHTIGDLRSAWQAAMNDSTSGVPADDVLDRLESKYAAMDHATGSDT